MSEVEPRQPDARKRPEAGDSDLASWECIVADGGAAARDTHTHNLYGVTATSHGTAPGTARD